MMYTKGVKKIFVYSAGVLVFSRVCFLAWEAGYKALSWNGCVYVLTDNGDWIKSCFHVTDFSDEQE